MKQILMFLACDGAFLYEEHGFRIVDSEYISAFGGPGSVVLSNDTLEIRLYLDRDRQSVDFRGKRRKSFQAWFAIDVVRQLVTGEIDKGLLDAENIAFLRQNVVKLQQLFGKASLAATEKALRKLEKERSRRLFG